MGYSFPTPELNKENLKSIANENIYFKKLVYHKDITTVTFRNINEQIMVF